MSKEDKTITVTLTFNKGNLNSILDAANFHEEGSWTVDQVIAEGRWEELEKELQDTADNFVEEIVDGSYEACANDWLSGFGAPEEDED